MVKWGNEVLTKVKVVVVHSWGQNDTTGTTTFIVKIFAMLVAYQFVFHSMHKESWTSHPPNLVNILKSILNQILKQSPCLVLSYGSNALKAAHKKKASRISYAGHMCSRSRTHRPSKYNDVFFFYSEYHVTIIIDVFRIIKYIFLVGIENVIIVGLIRVIFTIFLSLYLFVHLGVWNIWGTATVMGSCSWYSVDAERVLDLNRLHIVRVLLLLTHIQWLRSVSSWLRKATVWVVLKPWRL